jgi:hypothetical protein
MVRVDGAWKPAEAVRDPRPRSGQARPQSKDSCPSYDDFSPGSTVRGVRVLDGVRWRK